MRPLQNLYSIDLIIYLINLQRRNLIFGMDAGPAQTNSVLASRRDRDRDSHDHRLDLSRGLSGLCERTISRNTGVPNVGLHF